jgi:hypothetical protein
MQLLTVFQLLLLLSLCSLPVSSSECSVSDRITASQSLPSSQRIPTLLFWDTEGVNYEMYGMWFGPKSFYQCPVECHIIASRDENALKQAEGVLFWATPIDKGVDFDKKCPKQIWFAASTEAFDIRILDKTPPLVRIPVYMHFCYFLLWNCRCMAHAPLCFCSVSLFSCPAVKVRWLMAVPVQLIWK